MDRIRIRLMINLVKCFCLFLNGVSYITDTSE